MTMNMIVLYSLLLSLLLLCSVTNAATFQLFYDGIVSPQIIELYREQHQESTTTTSSDHDGIPYNMISDLTTSFMTDAIQNVMTATTMTKDPTNTGSPIINSHEQTFEMDRRCYTNNKQRRIGRCTIDHYSNHNHDAVMIHVSSHFYSSQNQVLVQLEVAITMPNIKGKILAKDALVNCIPKINHHIKYFDEVVWSIHERLSPMELTHPTTVAASQHLADLTASSVDTLILSQPARKDRIRIASNISNEMSLEVWQYQDFTFSQPVRSLFMNGQLLTTTHPSGTAHAEALVHPALISSQYTEFIVILSLDPTAALKEILKHKGVKRVVVLGMDWTIVKMTQKFMPHLDDCTFLGNSETSCLYQNIVEIVELNATTWMKQGAEAAAAVPLDEDPYDDFIDVVYIDVPIGNDEWLDIDFQKDVHVNLLDSSVVVIAAGSQPKLFEIEDNYLSPRDHFMRQAFRISPHGLGYVKGSVYDETLAIPLASAFVILFSENSNTFKSFMRTNSPAIEVDVIEKLHNNIAVLPTLVYDGMTHTQYNTLSRAWEHWYCKSLPGRDLPICNSFLARWFNADHHFYDTEVRHHPVKGPTLFAIKDCPIGNFVLPHNAGLTLHLDSQRWAALNKFINDFPAVEMYHRLRHFFDVYGLESEPFRSNDRYVSIGCDMIFAHHGCGDQDANIGLLEYALFGEDKNHFSPFSPPLHRKSELLGVLVETGTHIKKGEEIIGNCATFREKGNRVGSHKGIRLVPTTKAGRYGNKFVNTGSVSESVHRRDVAAAMDFDGEL